MVYRKLEVEEYLSVVPMILDFCRETGADNEAIGAIMSRIGDGKTEIFAAIDGSICGILGYFMAGEAAIPDFFYVVPLNRNRTLGGRLYRLAEKHAKGKGARKIVPIVTEDKEPLYTKIGFKRKFILLEKEI